MDVLLLLVALVVILLGAELFTNGIEWFGHRLNLAEGAVGSVLAAVGTALPETMIPLVAILFATSGAQESAHAIGVGAILGAPFMLATLAMFVTGVAVVARARSRGSDDRMPVKTDVLGTDIVYFFVAYALAVSTAFLPSDADMLRLLAAGGLVLIYAVYVRAHFVADPDIDASDLAPLRFGRLDGAQRHGEQSHPQEVLRAEPTDTPAARAGTRLREQMGPRMRVISLQVLAALVLIIGGAVGFVSGVESLARSVGISPVILSLVIAPIATELPEKFNSILWIRSGKDTLAMGNITGAMVFQSCIPTIFGLVFAAEAWRIDLSSAESVLAFASVGIAFASTAFVFAPMILRQRLTGRGLLVGGAFYVAYLALVVAVAPAAH